ncbi:FAD-dependent oxidoreductase [Eubacteriaceae bacterium ES3]|nr:FAD-dependent oxidoreductase [Eubacteriaceae bacterium ES3]
MDLEHLLSIGEKCIRSEPPACFAACPIHVDVIGMMKAVEKGDYNAAYGLLEKKMPLIKLVGKICDHPCEKSCVRNEKGGALQIGEIEKAVLTYGTAPKKKKLPVTRVKGKVAVIGGGISGLVAALDLSSKGYQVTICEKSDRLGGGFWQFEGNQLCFEEIAESLKIFDTTKFKVKLNTQIKDLTELLSEYDGVYLGTGEWHESLDINQQTFQVGDSRIFAGGMLILEKDSVIQRISTGRRAAVSLDRFIGNVSMMASREREGVFETPLKYETKDFSVIEAVEPVGSAFTEEEATQEAGRCLKCQCDACIKACVHMQRFEMTPDAYIRQINQNERIILGTHYANQMINSCTECGLCKEACFLDISMKDIIHETRESMVARKKMPLSAHDFALKDMKFSNSDRFWLVKKQPDKESNKDLFFYPQVNFDPYIRGLYKGTGKTGFLFYPGCQLSASHHQYIEDIYRYLVASIKDKGTQDDVGLFLGCCGAPADWAGRKVLADENIERIRTVWEEMGEPTFILACSSCMAVFEKYLPQIKTVSLWEIYDQYGLPQPKVRPGRPEIFVHDACATRNQANIHQNIRNIANKLGYAVKELPYHKENTKCCGYGGLVSYANSDQAKDFIKDRMLESQGALLVYCAMCKDQMVSEGQRTFHILDLIYGGDPEVLALRKNPTLSARHENRASLKINLCKNIWSETLEGESRMENLKIEESVSDIMEKRYILREDLESVILNAIENNEYFYDDEKDEYLSRLRLDEVTFWAQYKIADQLIELVNTYSHRMEVVED